MMTEEVQRVVRPIEQMSLTELLLFREVPDFPAGRRHKHQVITDAVARFKVSQKNVQAQNIEAVFSAIAGGACTNVLMQEVTKLSKACCHNACCRLLLAGRVYRSTGQARHAYYVKEQ